MEIHFAAQNRDIGLCCASSFALRNYDPTSLEFPLWKFILLRKTMILDRNCFYADKSNRNSEKPQMWFFNIMPALSIFPGRHQPSIFDANELNFCVRNGNRWDLAAINTDL